MRAVASGLREGLAVSVHHAPRRLSLRDRFQIKDVLSGGLLPCGCAFGRYLTYSGAVLTVIDDASACREGHEAEVVVEETQPGGSLRTEN